jgi:hypothetical protein
MQTLWQSYQQGVQFCYEILSLTSSILTLLQMSTEYFKLADLYVGAVGCLVLVCVDEVDGPKFVDKIDCHKASWVVMNPTGFKVDVEVIKKDEAEIASWVEKLSLQRVVILELSNYGTEEPQVRRSIHVRSDLIFKVLLKFIL